MSKAHDVLFRTLADPTRRAIVERWKKFFANLEQVLARKD
jgi:hypothetical protein